MIALLYKGLYITAKRVEASFDDRFCSMLSVIEPLCNLNMKPENFNILDSEFGTNVSHPLT